MYVYIYDIVLSVFCVAREVMVQLKMLLIFYYAGHLLRGRQ